MFLLKTKLDNAKKDAHLLIKVEKPFKIFAKV